MIRIASLATAVFLAGHGSALAQPAPARALVLETEATERIEQLEDVGRTVLFHLDRIEMLLSSSQVTAWSHYHHLDAIKDEVNGVLKPALVRLVAIERELPEWKQESVARMEGAARELAADLSTAIFIKAKDQKTPPMMNEEYKQLMKAVRGHAETLVTTADAAHTYAVAHRKALAEGLPVTPKS